MDTEIPIESDPPPLHCSASTSPSNPQPLKTSRRPPFIMTRLSNPIAAAQTQGSALNPLVSDCFSRVKWLCPPCHSPSHRRRRRRRHPGCLELLRREPPPPLSLADLFRQQASNMHVGGWLAGFQEVTEVGPTPKLVLYRDPSNDLTTGPNLHNVRLQSEKSIEPP